MQNASAPVLQYTSAARNNKNTRIILRDLAPAIRNNTELNKLVSRMIIAQGGVLSNTHLKLINYKDGLPKT